MKKLSFAIAMLACYSFGTARSANAELVFTVNFEADFEFEVVDGPFSALPELGVGDILPFRALGPLTFTLDDSIPAASSMAFTDVTGTLAGVSPGPFLPFDITPDVEFEGGSLNNIVRDAGGQITSADVIDLRMLWEMSGTPVILGGQDVLLYTADSLDFNGHVTSVPFASGDLIAGADEFEVYLDLGLGNPGLPGGDPLAVLGRNRTLTAIPEPSSVALLATAVGSCAVFRRRSRENKTRTAT